MRSVEESGRSVSVSPRCCVSTSLTPKLWRTSNSNGGGSWVLVSESTGTITFACGDNVPVSLGAFAAPSIGRGFTNVRAGGGNSTHSTWRTSSFIICSWIDCIKKNAAIRCNIRAIINAASCRWRRPARRTLCCILKSGKYLIACRLRSWLCIHVFERRELMRTRGKSLVACFCPCTVCPFQTGLVHASMAQNAIRFVRGKFIVWTLDLLFASVLLILLLSEWDITRKCLRTIMRILL